MAILVNIYRMAQRIIFKHQLNIKASLNFHVCNRSILNYCYWWHSIFFNRTSILR